MLAALGLHPAQMAVAHGLASGAIHPAHVLDAITPKGTGDLSAGPTASSPAPTPIAAPGSTPIAPPITTPSNPKLDADRAELARKESTGSGLEQFQHRHPILGTAARIATGVGSAMFPSIAEAIPGTDLHHQMLVNQDRGKVAEDLGVQQKQAQTAQEQATTGKTLAETEAIKNPQVKPKEENWERLEGFTGPNGEPLEIEKNSGKARFVEGVPGAKSAKAETPFQTDKTVRIVNGVPHEVLFDKQTGADVKDLGQTKIPGESKEDKLSAQEKVQVEREARAAVHKAEQDYNGARSTVAMQRQLIKDAKGGNKEAVRIVPLEGALQITTSQGVHRINRTEVEQYGQAGSLYDRIVGAIGGGVSGKNIPDNVLSDMDAMTQELERNAHDRYKREYDYNKSVVEGYGGKDFEKRVPMVQGDTGGGGGNEPHRPPNVPPNYVFQENGPKGRGWYRP